MCSVQQTPKKREMARSQSAQAMETNIMIPVNITPGDGANTHQGVSLGSAMQGLGGSAGGVSGTNNSVSRSSTPRSPVSSSTVAVAVAQQVSACFSDRL